MKERQYNKTRGVSNDYPTKGKLPRWEMEGYVQLVSENKKYELDYIQFCIDSAFTEDYYEVFAVSLPHDLGYELEVGDRVRMTGTIRTWKAESGRKIELVADGVWLKQ